jgi:LPXTG-motif cell wall-anchored protein
MRSRTFRGSVAIVALTAAALIGTAGSALACNTGDNRPHPVPGKVTPCAEKEKDVTVKDVDVKEGTGTGTRSLTITGVHEGVTITRIVVKGGNDGFNEYFPGKKGKGGEKLSLTAPWENLVAPYDLGGNRATKIDDWFVCGTKTSKPTETKTPPTTKPTETTKPSAPATSDTVSPASTTPAVVPAGNESGTGGGLANTGFDNMWLVWIAALLILGGGGLLALLKFRRKASE